MSDHSVTYRLDPPDRTGILLGLTAAQLGCLAAGVLGLIAGAKGVVALPVGLFAAAICGVVGLARYQGTPLVEHAPTMGRWLWGRVARRDLWLAELPLLADGGKDRLPPCLAGQVMLAVPAAIAGLAGRVAPVAVIWDRQGGTFATTLRVTGNRFALRDSTEQNRLVDRWGSALAGFCRNNSPVTQVRWAEWAVPESLEEHRRWIEHHALDSDGEAKATYDTLVADAGLVATRHEVLVTLQVANSHIPRKVRGSDLKEAVVKALCRETALFITRLADAELTVTGPLTPAEVVRAVRMRLDPAAVPALERQAHTLAQTAGLVPLHAATPLTTSSDFTHWRTDSAYHRALYVSDWPRTKVPGAWMGPLLLAHGQVRTFAVFYEPVAPHRALHAANQQAAKVQSDAHQRAKRGLRVGATYDRAAHGAEQREQELVAGYGEHRYAGVIVVSADSLEHLDQGTDEMISKAASHGLDLRALHGRHDVAVAATLPLARGLAPTRA